MREYLYPNLPVITCKRGTLNFVLTKRDFIKCTSANEEDDTADDEGGDDADSDK